MQVQKLSKNLSIFLSFIFLLTGLLVPFAGCGNGNIIIAEAKIASDTGGILQSENKAFSLEIPAGALEKDTKITATVVTEEEWDDVTTALQPLGEVLRLEPSGLEFSKPLVITAQLDSETYKKLDMSGGYPFLFFFVKSEDGSWDTLDNVEITINEENKTVTVTGEVQHFSDFVLVDGDVKVQMKPNEVEKKINEEFSPTVTITNTNTLQYLEGNAKYTTSIGMELVPPVAGAPFIVSADSTIDLDPSPTYRCVSAGLGEYYAKLDMVFSVAVMDALLLYAGGALRDGAVEELSVKLTVMGRCRCLEDETEDLLISVEPVNDPPVLEGSPGDDVLDGSPDDDVLLGGPDDDLLGDGPGDPIIGDPNDDGTIDIQDVNDPPVIDPPDNDLPEGDVNDDMPIDIQDVNDPPVFTPSDPPAIDWWQENAPGDNHVIILISWVPDMPCTATLYGEGVTNWPRQQTGVFGPDGTLRFDWTLDRDGLCQLVGTAGNDMPFNQQIDILGVLPPAFDPTAPPTTGPSTSSPSVCPVCGTWPCTCP